VAGPRVEIWKRRHALVSHADPQQIVIASECALPSLLRQRRVHGLEQGIEANWLSYYEWSSSVAASRFRLGHHPRRDRG